MTQNFQNNFSTYTVNEILRRKLKRNLPELLKSWLGSKPINILDLSGAPSSIMDSIIGVLLRMLYEALFWAKDLPQGGKKRPLLIVMEEAHNYLDGSSKGMALSMVQKIVKEGRKYGIGVMIVSQRPSEINSTILSQCGTFFALRLSNNTDRAHITGAVTENLEGLTNMLPVLRTGEAIVLGEAVRLPMRIMIENLPEDRRPNSQDPIVYGDLPTGQPLGWKVKKEEKDSDYKNIVTAWICKNLMISNTKDQPDNN